jgi:hypothetical protein
MRRLLLLSLWIPNYSFAARAEQQVVTSAQTISLGIEDCSEATRRHAEDERAPASQSAISRADSFLPAGEIRGSE